MKKHSIEKAYHKVVSVIKSCKNKTHLEGALKMVINFKNIYGIVGYPRVFYYNLDRLIDKQQTKWI